MGHALAAITLTKNNVEVFLGSHGNKDGCFRLKCGRIEIWGKYLFFFWQKGECQFIVKNSPSNKFALIIAMGPFANLLSIPFFLLIALQLDHFENIQIFLLWSCVSAAFCFILNLIPFSFKSNGQQLFSDGYKLWILLKYKFFPNDEIRAMQFYRAKEYKKATALFEKLITKAPLKPDSLRYAISSNLMSKRFERALLLSEELKKMINLTTNDFTTLGIISICQKRHNESINYNNMALSLDGNNKAALNNRGYSYNILSEYDKAIPDLQMALKVDPEYAVAHNNLGFAMYKMGMVEDGLKHIKYSMKLENKNPHTYLYLGIYHFDIGEFNEAKSLLTKAKSLDNDIEYADDYLDKIAKVKN